MRTCRFLPGGILLAALVSGCAGANADPTARAPTIAAAPNRAAAVAQLRASLEALVACRDIPGAIVKIVQDGRTLADVEVGYRDVAELTPMTEETIFRLYSMSKPITSVAIMMLVEEGSLALEDSAEKFLPELHDMRVYAGGSVDNMDTVPATRPVTIADLLTHRSGITYHFTGNTPVHQYYRKYGVMRDTPVGRTPEDGPPARSLDELVERIGRAPLLHQPGEQFDYSYSTTVLGAVIERVSGMRLDRFLKMRIFDRLDMPDTGFFVQGAALDRLIVNYVASDDGLTAIEDRTNTDYSDPNRLLDGGGAIAGTANDYLHFAEMLANKGVYRGRRLLREESIEAMFTPHVRLGGPGGDQGWFGYGFSIGDVASAASGMQPAGTFGWSGSGNTYFFVDPERKAVALLMTQVIVAGPYQDRTWTLRRTVNTAAEALLR